MTTNIDDISTLHLKSFKSIIRVHGGDNWIRKTDLLIPLNSIFINWLLWEEKNNLLWLNIKTLRTNALVYHIRHTHILTLMCFLLYHISPKLWRIFGQPLFYLLHVVSPGSPLPQVHYLTIQNNIKTLWHCSVFVVYIIGHIIYHHWTVWLMF